MSLGIVTVWYERGKFSRRGSKGACLWVLVAMLFGVVTLGGGGGVLMLLHHSATRCHTRSLDHRNETRPVTVRMQHNGGVWTNDSSAYWLSEGDELHSRLSRREGAALTAYNFAQHLRSLHVEESPAQRLHRLLTQPTTTCRKLIRVGGRSCLGAYDGSKVSE